MNYKKLFIDVFDPQPSDKFIFIEEIPVSDVVDDEWVLRHQMMIRWKAGIEDLAQSMGFIVLPDLRYEEPITHNAPVERCILANGQNVSFESALHDATVFIAFGRTSISAPLINLCRKLKTLRGASMPGIIAEMENTALSADYGEIQRKCDKIAKLMEKAEYAIVDFSTGHTCCFDLRFQKPIKDDGYCGFHKLSSGDIPIINLPSGEVCQAPYEGYKTGIKSKTCGTIPIFKGDRTILLYIDNNKIFNVDGLEEEIDYFLSEPGRCNIAEFAIGVNDKAVVRGNELEDEKAGFHFAYGRSDHIGGIVGPEEFKNHYNVCHIDVVYAKDSPISVRELKFINKDNSETYIYKEGELIV